ncbi:hypothetical protein [Streptomyces chrestomyceticus]|uniref:hypothetical protein n=1 Tax=Streptomyces chrestomyceticus TaxID=68185 RepID=UPI0019D27B37|nr:hypothetical protein [Streptomyces chrestomyceticus]
MSDGSYRPPAHRSRVAPRVGGRSRLTGRDRTRADLLVTRGAVSPGLTAGGAAMDDSVIFEGRRWSLTLSGLHGISGSV